MKYIDVCHNNIYIYWNLSLYHNDFFNKEITIHSSIIILITNSALLSGKNAILGSFGDL